MATPPQIDVAALWLPITADGPSDVEADRDPVYAGFRRALRGGDVASQDLGSGEGRMAELGRLIDQGRAYLTRAAKDLVISAWIAEALTERAGFAGLRDGLELMRGLLADCWEDCYPRLGRDDDPELRARPLESLASERYLLLRLRRSSLSDPKAGAAPFCYLDVRKGPPNRTTALTEADLESGPIGEAIRRSPRRFYEYLVDDVRQAQEAARALVREVERRFPVEPPSLSPLDRALTDCRQAIEQILSVKRRQEPDPDPDGQAPIMPTPTSGPLATDRASGDPTVTGPSCAAIDYGRVLIEFSDRARTLADEIARLKANREEYENLKEKMKGLDAEYEDIIGRIARDRDYEPLLLHRLAGSRGEPPAV
jgi:type VI secretion system ImpA family protein